MITYGSICSGIESASVAWEPLGMRPLWYSEIEKFPKAVLAHHWPHVPDLGDMCALPGRVQRGEIQAPDILVGGTPCQAFSVAGARRGLDDDRGQLSMKFVELADEIDKIKKSVIIWENVPGVLSDKKNAFGCFLGALCGEDSELFPTGKKWTNAGIVHGPARAVAWRILDAQYFGVAQRRRRVFVIASARNGFDPGKVLSEREGVRRDTPPSREARQETAGGAGRSFSPASFGGYVEKCGTLRANGGDPGGGSENLIVYPIIDHATRHGVTTGGRGKGNGLGIGSPSDPCPTLTGGDRHAVYRMQALGSYKDDEIASTLKSRDYKDATDLIVDHATRCNPTGGPKTDPVFAGGIVRRLTPLECERLQGFPDDHTRIPWRGKAAEECPDGPRYKAIGNSKAVPVIAWLGRRIKNELESLGD